MSAAVEQLLTVGLGEIKTAAGSGVLMALGLGSCIGVAVWDPLMRVSGMAHVVLPAPPDSNPAGGPKFATQAIPMLLEQVVALGANRSRLVCKIAGGAQVLNSAAMRDSFRIGERNREAVLAALRAAGVRVQAEDCGGNTGRSFRLTAADGKMAVKRLGSDWKDL